MIEIIVKTETEPAIKKFPKLMINGNEEIVFFIREKYGLPINGYGWMYETMSADKWNMEDFIDYNEEVTIKNT